MLAPLLFLRSATALHVGRVPFAPAARRLSNAPAASRLSTLATTARASNTAAVPSSFKPSMDYPGVVPLRTSLVVPRSPQPVSFADDSDSVRRRAQADQSDAPPLLSPGEARRVAVFEDASPSVAFISTTILTPRGIVQAGAGSGFVWDADGHIVTNYHVVANPVARQPSQSRVMVSLQGIEGQVEATVVGHEADKDLAVLKVDPARLRPLKPLQVASSSTLRVGQDVLAIGNPFGLDYTLTTGIVSALGRDIDGYGGRPIKDCVQTDAAINPGNSGGPLLDSRGRLIGVNTMIFSPGGAGGNVGIGCAVPSDTVSRVVRQIVEFGNNARPSLGVNLLDDRAREQYARSLGRPLRGAILAEVVAGSPAEALSLAPCRRRYGSVVLGDMIVEVDGKPIGRNEDLICAIEEAEPGSAVSLKVVRNCDPERLEELRFTPVMRKTLAERR